MHKWHFRVDQLFVWEISVWLVVFVVLCMWIGFIVLCFWWFQSISLLIRVQLLLQKWPCCVMLKVTQFGTVVMWRNTFSVWNANSFIWYCDFVDGTLTDNLKDWCNVGIESRVCRVHTVKSTVRSMTTRLFTLYFRFQKTCNRNKSVWVSRWMSGFYITKSCKECHWTPFDPPNTLKGREYHFPVVRMFLRNFLISSAQKHPYIEKHTLLSQKWLLSIFRLMYCSIILTNNFRNTIFHRKVIAIKNWFYLHGKFAIKHVILLKLLTLVYFKRVFYICKISKHVIFNMHECL